MAAFFYAFDKFYSSLWNVVNRNNLLFFFPNDIQFGSNDVRPGWIRMMYAQVGYIINNAIVS